MLDSAKMRIGLLAGCGFHGKTIQDHVRKYDGKMYSLSQIYSVVAGLGIRLRDYRDGVGDDADIAFDRCDGRVAKEHRVKGRRR